MCLVKRLQHLSLVGVFKASEKIQLRVISASSAKYYEGYILSSDINHTITATAGEGGTISPSGAVSVSDGANQTFTIAEKSGYQISNILVDRSILWGY